MAFSFIEWFFLLSFILLGLATTSFSKGFSGIGRWMAIIGLGLLTLQFLSLAIDYAASTRGDRHFLTLVTTTGAIVSLLSTRLFYKRWFRMPELAGTLTAFTGVILIFNLIPDLHVFVQEQLANFMAYTLNEVLGYQASLENYQGGLVKLVFPNDGHCIVSRECNGMDGIAVFGALVLGAGISIRQKLKGLAFVIAMVMAINIGRMMFVTSAMAGNWFGPLLTNGQTLKTTYYIAEVGIGQTLVLLASVWGFWVINKWFTDFPIDFAESAFALKSFDKAKT